MQVYNIDETGISVVHKPGIIFSAVSKKHVYSLTSGEKGKTHTVVVRVSASVPGTIFMTNDSGWITQEIHIQWFITSIPPARPVLLIKDGHGSEM